MALVIKDRVKETTTTTGTGTYTLAGAEVGFQSFSTIGNGNTTYYTVTNGGDWEVGIGTYTASGTTLARTTILSSSNSDNAVSWLTGEKFVFVTQPSSKASFLDASGNLSLGDNDKAIFGAGSDLQIYHDSTTGKSHITESGVSHLVIQGQEIQFQTGLGTTLLVTDSLKVSLRYSGVQKLETSSSGISVSGNVAVTGTVDGRDVATDGATLDNLETEVAALANGMVYKGDWDASAGSFPSGAQTGWFYYVSVAGTVNSIAFHVGDNIVATTDNASTTTFANNWSKHDNTDAVQSVVGLIGSITKSSLLTAINVEDGADVTDTTNVTAAGALMDSEVTNLAQVKAFDSTDYATAAQGTTANNAVPKAGGTMTGTLFTPTVDFGDWTITETGGSLYFAYSGTNKFKLDSSGTLSVTNDVQTDQTIT
tara:strand:+ start:2091 stop:3365 length:1275 start_codon:yes stop_codon:yes gene_type:complete